MSDRAFTILAFHPNAIRFDDSTGITIPDNGYLSQPRITIECLVRFEDIDRSGSEVEIGVFDQYMLYKEGQEFGKVGFCLGHRRQKSGQYLYFRLFSTGFDMYDFYAMSGPINLNSLNWYHVAATFDGRVMKLYLYGDAIAETVIPLTHSFVIYNGNPLIFGFPRGLHGWLDEVRIWSAARTESEIRGTMYDDIGTGNGLIAAWHFNEPGGQSVIDSVKGINGFLGTGMYTLTQDPVRVETTLQHPFVHLTSPSGGESWEAGGTYPITWESRGVSTIRLVYSLDNGLTWKSIAENVPASSGSFMWKLPSVDSPQCIVRAYESTAGQEQDTSRRAFTISPTLVTVRSPDGGERFRSATTLEIKWESEGMETVDLSYSTDSGTTWNVIAAGVPASRKLYFWDLPQISSERCLVRVANSARLSTADVSDGVFTVADFPVRALSFSGKEIVTIPAIPIPSPKLITIECWAKFTNLENIGEQEGIFPFTQHLIYQEEVRDESAFSIDYYMYDGTRYLSFRFGRRTWNTAEAKCVNPPLIPNTWHHLAGKFDGKSIALYLDGREIAYATEDWFTISQHPVLFFGQNFSGEIDEVRLWSCAKIAEQIRETMGRELDSAPGLASVWHLRGEDKQVILDSAGKANGYLGSSPDGDIQDPLWTEEGSPISILTDVSDMRERPAVFALFQNTPNPFNPSTEISFSLPSREQVTLTVYSADGQKVLVLVSGVLDRGLHSFLWDGVDGSGVPVASGIYLYRLEAGRNIAVRKMALVK
jgi:hypothetical protein